MFQRSIYSHLVESLTSKEFQGDVDLRILRLHMQQEYKDVYSEDWQIVEDIFSRYEPVRAEDVAAVTRILSNFIKNRIYLKGVDLYTKGDLQSAEEYFSKATSFTISPDPFVNPLQEGMVERLRIKDLPVGGRVIRSSLGIINSSLQYKGYKNGDLIMVVMRPKCGKSTFMLQEAASAADQGFKVAHMFFGDFSEYDGLCKFMSCVSGELMSNVLNAPEYFKRQCESWLKNWRVAAFPAFALDCNEIVAYAKNYRKKFPFDMLVIDYDSNVRPPQDAGMYESGGVMYSTFKGFGQQEGAVVMIGSQPKLQYWGDELLSYACAAESSRKQHVVDVMITAGRNKGYRNVGTMNLPLIRRGESANNSKIRFDDFHSRILEINQLEYDNILRQHKEVQYTDAKDFSLDGIVFKDKPSSETGR